MKDISFGTIRIGETHPVVIIAEVACQHGGDMANAKRLVDAAKKSGADIVKFQLHRPEAEMTPKSIQFWGGGMDEILARSKFSTYEEHKELKTYCEKVGIVYLCTPFSKEAGDILERVGVSAFKTGSGELTNLPMIRHLARKGKPLIISTGMCTLDEIDDVASVCRKEQCDFMLTHCLSEYPPRYSDMNLRLIPELQERFGVPIGSSDHSPDWYSALAAVALGAKVLEKHFTLPDLHGPDDVVSLTPIRFAEMVRAVRVVEQTLIKKPKNISSSEQIVRNWAHHSVVTMDAVRAGDALCVDALTAKRPGSGILAKYLDPLHSEALAGKRFKKALPRNTVVRWEDIE